MIHYTCDRCQRLIDSDVEPRYLVRVDVEVIASGTAESADAETIDYLADLNEALEQERLAATHCEDADDSLEFLHNALSCGEDLDHPASAFASTAACQEQAPTACSLPPSFDLCPQCYAKYMQNPLSRERSLKLHFSNN